MNEEAIIEKLAEKIGVAVEALQPVAEEVVRQYVLKSWTYCGLGVFLILAAVGLFGLACRLEDDLFVVPVFLGAAAFVTGGIVVGVNLGRAIAPYPSLLGL